MYATTQRPPAWRAELERRRDICATTGITLNGRPAKICGAGLDFPHVRELTPDGKAGLDVEYAWETVRHVLATKAGAFTA